MKKFINAGFNVPFNNLGTVVNGALVSKGGALRGVADRGGVVGDTNELLRQGNFSLPKIAGALALGAVYKVDITDGEAGVHSADALSGTVVAFGIVSRAALSADAEVDVILTPEA